MNRKTIVGLLVILLLGACAKPSKEAENFRLGIVLRNEENSGSQQLHREIVTSLAKQTKKAYDDYQALFRDAQADQARQMELIDKFIEEEVDVLIVELVQTYAAATVVSKAQTADIPVIFVNVHPLNVPDLLIWPGKTAFVGGDRNQAYLMLANHLNKQNKRGNLNNNSALEFSWLIKDRTLLNKKQAEEYPLSGGYPTVLRDYEIIKGSDKAINTVMKNLLKAENVKKLDVVFCDDLQIAAKFLSLKEAAKVELYIMAFDYNPLNDDLPNIDAILLSDYPRQAAQVVKLTIDLCKGKTVKPYHPIQWLLIDKK